jgi:hypothetical protein
MRLVVRAAVVLAALVLLAGYLAAFGAAFAGTPAYPDPGAIDDGYDDRVGDAVHLWGRVVAETPGGFAMRAGPLRLSVRTDAPVAAGDYVQVYGVLRPGGGLDARRVVTRTPGERARLFAVSALALPVVAAAFRRRWRVRLRPPGFEPRGADDPAPAADGRDGDAPGPGTPGADADGGESTEGGDRGG